MLIVALPYQELGMKRVQGVSLGLAMMMAVSTGAVPVMAASSQNPTAAATPQSAASRKATAAKPAPPQTEEEKTLYALGVIISRNLENFQLSAAEFDWVKAGLVDGVNHRAGQVDLANTTPMVKALERERVALLTKKLQQDGQGYLDRAAALPGAHKTASGLVMVPIHAGSGASPGLGNGVKVNYEGKLIDGTVFDSSIRRGEPSFFSLSGVIPCWSEALQIMKVGEKSRLVCPPDLAYGARGAPPMIRPQSTLDFEVELVEIAAAPAAAAPPTAPTPPAPLTAPAAPSVAK
jgi:FKBP-type peptidyl-prolyl cis-trans isomerase FkpA